MKSRRASGSLVAIVLTATSSLFAQDEIDESDAAVDDSDGMSEEASEVSEPEPEGDAAAGASAPSEQASSDSDEAAGSSSKEGADGGRFRFGIAGGVGPMSGAGLNLTYYGMDMRFGAQLNDAIGIYAQPQLGYYKLNGADALFGSGGLIGASVLADYTLFDRLFLGAGVGYAILNNPAGMELHFRAGGYPLMGRSKEKVRRKGLMLGADLRLHFVEGYTFVAPTFNLGYEAY